MNPSVLLLVLHLPGLTWQIMTAPSKMWAQTGGSADFLHPLTATDTVISKVPPITIPFPGVWEISYHARSSVSLSTDAQLWVSTALYNGQNLIPSSEAIAGIDGRSGQGSQATTGQTVMAAFKESDVITLHGRYIGQGIASIISNSDGRTTIMAHWVSAV